MTETATLDALFAETLGGSRGPHPSELVATSVFWLQHGTRLAGSNTTSLNRYVLVRVGHSYGACAFEAGELTANICSEASGSRLDVLMRDAPLALRVAALDAYLTEVEHHQDRADAEAVALPAGTPEQRARARDEAITGLLDAAPGTKVALIGVVSPLVTALHERGCVCLPCDYNLDTTVDGGLVTSVMNEVLEPADAVVATGMTLGNGTFEGILRHCGQRGVPLTLYAQSGAAVARAFLGSGVTALSAEPFPFSQFDSGPTTLYRYRAGHSS
ncbi:hypothetical protein CDG81_12615 [Actinopolyspora erythraea]|uniref:Putative heavy-metal chelation domain-containing protein n=1 Tax=Actinopolyspora erythraea TaxID=414996 RepID=A0A099D5N1_9ACTN|nr:DUF364 domain-containing protein [Actinopolyspora erythraea]ASU78990.1 hypothetical protein CDG81_12615 [Actinopolyspora erythraea]KGI81117.1 hypothetical protein IL38_12700 [Actinopolyspora erythraea]